MPVSHALRGIFVHIPKTGGTSVETALGMFHDWKIENRAALFGLIQSPDLRQKGFLSHFLQHLTWPQLRELLPPECRGYFTFSVVRNPWERMVSTYANKDPDMLMHARAQGLELEGLSFEEFLEKTENFQHIHLLPQHEFIYDQQGTPLVDFIGRFERLAEDFQRICARLGVDGGLPHRNPSRHRPYRDYYDNTTQDMVAQRYRRDIALLGYEF
jgi:hypothetical protein